MNRHLSLRLALPVLVVTATILIGYGCTVRPDIAETLDVTGNHSTGDLVMVTADTSKDGYQYLEPQMSPDQTRIVFSLDWNALPPPGHPPDVPPMIRQLAIIPVQEQRRPQLSLSEEGAHLIRFRPITYIIAGNAQLLDPEQDLQKGSPVWIDADNILFWMETPRGARLFRANVPQNYDESSLLVAEPVYREPDDDSSSGLNWEDYSPAVSPDGRWVVFSRFGYVNLDSLNTITQQSLWVCAMPEAGELSPLAFPVTSGAAICDAPSWSPDGRKIVFHATLDLIDQNDYYSQELFTIDFDTTGVAANGHPTLNNNLDRLTYSEPDAGSNVKIRNTDPVYSADGLIIAFVSDRRVPTITLRERNIWYIPSDGSLAPRLLFFSRSDDVDPSFTGRPGRELLLSSAMGFPTELLDEIWQETADSLQAQHPDWPLPLVEQGANAVRDQLATYEGVMSLLYLFSNW